MTTFKYFLRNSKDFFLVLIVEVILLKIIRENLELISLAGTFSRVYFNNFQSSDNNIYNNNKKLS